MSAPELATIARCLKSLSPEHRRELVQKAVGLVEWERRASLCPLERERADLVDQYVRCLDLLAETDNPADRHGQRIQRAIWREHAREARLKLIALGVEYFGAAH